MESIDFKNLDIPELTNLVNSYPWFAAARKVLCEKTLRLAGKDAALRVFSEAAPYFGDRSILSEGFRSEETGQIGKDKDIEALVKAYLKDTQKKEGENATSSQTPRIVVVGGDYFSPLEYEQIRSSEAYSGFGRIASNATESAGKEPVIYDNASDEEDSSFESICTETLAQIYADQGYADKAKIIYSKLILRYPEKNAYFAALIEKLDKEINN